MSAFKRFGPGDQIDNVLVLEPQWDLASGSAGWRGSPEGSGSVSLYGGLRRATPGVVREYRYQPTIPGIGSFGQLARSGPITASVNYVYATDEDLNLAQRSSTRWGHEHWKTVMRLYDYYSRRDPDYTTASYDHYCLYFQRDSKNIVTLAGPTLTGSFTLESWVKPFVTSSDLTVQAKTSMFWFGVTGSTGLLVLSSSAGSVTSSAGPVPGEWSHVAVSYDAGSSSGIFYLNLREVGRFSKAALPAPATTVMHTVGNVIAGTGNETTSSTGSVGRSFFGFIGETRAWGYARSWTQISGTADQRLVNATGSQLCLQFNEGPLTRVAALTVGSGALDSALLGTARLLGFDDRVGPSWHPNDNIDFTVPKELETSPVSALRIVSVPAAMYGRRIVPGTVELTCQAFSSGSHGLVRRLVDDGRGNLYMLEVRPRAVSAAPVSSSVTSSFSPALFIFAGQSNAVGEADWSGKVSNAVNPQPFMQDPSERYEVPVDLGVPYLAQYSQARTTPVAWSSITGTVRPYDVSGNVNMGPELSAARVLQNYAPSGSALAKYAAFATYLSLDWSATGSALNLFPGFCDFIDARLAATGLPLGGVMWIQGEGDATNASYASAYSQNLQDLVTAFRNRYGNVPWTLSRLCSAGNMTQLATVRAQQAAFTASMSNTAMIDTDDFTQPGALHYDARDMQILGERLMKQTLQMSDRFRVPAVSAPTFVGAGPGKDRFSVATPGVKWPGITVPDDIGILVVGGSRGNFAATVPDTPAGFAYIGTAHSVSGTDHQFTSLYWCRASAATMSGNYGQMPTVKLNNTNFNNYGRIFVFRGCTNSGNPWETSGSMVNNSLGTTWTVPGGTVTGNRKLVVFTGAIVSGSTDNTLGSFTSPNIADIAQVKNGIDQNGGDPPWMQQTVLVSGSVAGTYAPTTGSFARQAVYSGMYLTLK